MSFISLTPILTHHSNITGRSLASEHLPRCSCLPASTVSLKCYHDCLNRHIPRPHRARISFPTVQLFTSIARRSDTISPRPVPISSWTLWSISSDFPSHVPSSLQSHSWAVSGAFLPFLFFSPTVPTPGYLTSTASRSAVGTFFDDTIVLCGTDIQKDHTSFFQNDCFLSFFRRALFCFMFRNAAYSAGATLGSGLGGEGWVAGSNGRCKLEKWFFGYVHMHFLTSHVCGVI
jgi:hypothetical protein